MNKASRSTNISKHETGYQVRIKRRRKEISRYFSFSQYGSVNNTLREAKAWRNYIKSIGKNNTRRFLKTPDTDHSTGFRGISRTISYDKRNKQHYINFSVCWTDSKGVLRNKKFHVGNTETFLPEKDVLAFSVAKIFRADWENHADLDKLDGFNPNRYKGWQKLWATELLPNSDDRTCEIIEIGISYKDIHST